MVSEGKEKALQYDAAFRSSEHANHLKYTPRWSRYKPEETDISAWRDTLHADSDGLDHTRLILNLLDLFLRSDPENTARLSDEDRGLLFLSAAMQDWGKSSDVSYEFITGADIEERSAKLHTLFDELAPELDTKQRHIVERTIYDKDTRLGEVFDAIRRLNCLRTGIIAYEKYASEPDTDEHANLGALALGVLSNQLVYLITYAEKFAPVGKALDDAKEYIEKIFADRTVRRHPFIAPQHTREAVERAEMIWNRSHGEKSAVGTEQKRPRDDTLFSPDALFEKRFINDKEQLARIVESLRSLGMRITLTSGSFDMLHIGHARYLERAAQHGDILIVGVDSDTKIKKRKGESRPVVGENERLQLLSYIRGVDILTLKEPEEEKWGLIKLVHPDTLIVTAETYTPDEIRQLEGSYCGRVIVLEPQATTSTGAQIRRIQIGEKHSTLREIEALADEEGWSDEVRRTLGRVIARALGRE